MSCLIQCQALQINLSAINCFNFTKFCCERLIEAAESSYHLSKDKCVSLHACIFIREGVFDWQPDLEVIRRVQLENKNEVLFSSLPIIICIFNLFNLQVSGDAGLEWRLQLLQWQVARL